MEKLRDHERESSCRSSVISHLSASTPASVPPAEEPKKFCHVARRVMKRTSVASALSVLSPANREYLNSQGSKSPEIPRKRMIIGQRSFTFSGDGDLIEVESSPLSPSVLCTPPEKQERGPTKRLVHKDSVLSLATSASMTSMDSDSDTDDRSSEYEVHNRIARLPSTLPCCNNGPALPIVTTTSTQASHHHKFLDKRLSSTSISSWEMETSAHSTELSSHGLGASGPGSGNGDEGLKPQTHFSALNFPRTKCESIDEDVTMEAMSEPFNRLQSSSMVKKVESVSDVELGTEVREEFCDLSSRLMDEAVLSPSPALVQQPQTPTCLARDQVCMLHRIRPSCRGSLKRQQHIVEDDDIDGTEEGSEDTAAVQEPYTATFPQPNNGSLLPVVPDTRGDSFEMEEILPLDEEKELLNLTRARSESSGFLDGDIMENFPSSNCSPNNESSIISDQTLGTLESFQSTTDSGNVSKSVREVGAEYENVFASDTEAAETRLPIQHDDAVVPVRGCIDANCGSGIQENVLCDGSSFPLDQVPTDEGDVWSMLGIWGNDKYMKRLSLPVVCVRDELGNLSRLSTSSSRSCASDNGSTVTCTVRRVKSAPQSLYDEGELHATTIQTCGSFSNMFSFCSDESVIHISSRKGAAGSCRWHHHSSSNSRRQSASFDNLNVQHSGHYGARHSFQEGRVWNFQQAGEKYESTKHAAKDLQELIHELTARGLEVGKYFDTHNACHSESQQAHMHASTLRLTVEAYKKQLNVGSEVQLDGLEECAEAQQELEVTRNICNRITAELRHIADLLEEKPTVKMANVTCQMTELLCEQTRLYEQLTSRGMCADTTLPPDVVSLHSSLKPQIDIPRLNRCCCSKQIISVVREEHGRLEQLIKKNTDELTEIRHLLCELLSKNNDSLFQTQKHL